MADSINQEVAWNLSQAIIDEISVLLNSATNNYIKYNLEGCFRNLKAIKMMVIANLKQEERNTFKEKENKLGSLLSKISITKVGFNLNKQINFTKENGAEITKQLEEYQESLMDILKKYGYLIPPKEDKKNLNK